MRDVNFSPVNDVLVAIVPEIRDFHLLQKEQWYRVRIGKQTPLALKRGQVQWIAFYFPAIFKNHKYQVQYIAEVFSVKEVGFFDLFPNESANHPKANRRYYKVDVKNLQELPEPIVSRRGRRNPFISTTKEKLDKAKEINDLFNESPLEDMLWEALKARGIEAERQYWEEVNGQHFFLDFAVFCQNKKGVDIECDGITYHSSLERQEYDRNRNNDLGEHGWKVLRYSSKRLENDLPGVLTQISNTIDLYGGLQLANEPDSPKYIAKGKSGQLRMFE